MIKNILVAGSSIAAGAGFPQRINDPDTWPNQLKNKLNCKLDNVSCAGYDFPGIFFLATRKIMIEDYDAILIEVPPLNRLIVRPNIHSFLDVAGRHNFDDIPEWHEWFDNNLFITKKDWRVFQRVMVMLNTDLEHWKKLVGIIVTAQILIKNKYNIKFINNALPWTPDFFTQWDSDFARRIISADALPDHQISTGLEIINQDKKLINLSHWINPFTPLITSAVDRVSDNDRHPGKKSNDITSDMIIECLSKK